MARQRDLHRHNGSALSSFDLGGIVLGGVHEGLRDPDDGGVVFIGEVVGHLGFLRPLGWSRAIYPKGIPRFARSRTRVRQMRVCRAALPIRSAPVGPTCLQSGPASEKSGSVASSRGAGSHDLY